MLTFIEGIATGVGASILSSIIAAYTLTRHFKNHPEKLYSTFIRRNKK